MPDLAPPSTSHYRMEAASLLNLTDAVGRLGADPDALLAAVGLSTEALRQPGARVPADLAPVVWAAAAAALGDPHLGLHVGSTAALGRWGLAEQVVLHAETLGDGIGAAVRFAALFSEAKRLRLDRLGDRALFTVAVVADGDTDRVGLRHAAEADLVYAVRLIRLAASPAFAPVEVHFAHPKPSGADAAVYDAAFGVPVAFGRPTHALAFDAAWLAAPMASAVPALRVPLEVEAARALADLDAGAPLVERAAALVRVDPATVTASDVAAGLHVSVRTLQRRLADEGTTFRAVVDGVRREYAAALLRAPGVTTGEASHRLGFSEPSAFRRAVRRWFGAPMTVIRSGRAIAGREP